VKTDVENPFVSLVHASVINTPTRKFLILDQRCSDKCGAAAPSYTYCYKSVQQLLSRQMRENRCACSSNLVAYEVVIDVVAVAVLVFVVVVFVVIVDVVVVESNGCRTSL